MAFVGDGGLEFIWKIEAGDAPLVKRGVLGYVVSKAEIGALP